MKMKSVKAWAVKWKDGGPILTLIRQSRDEVWNGLWTNWRCPDVPMNDFKKERRKEGYRVVRVEITEVRK